MEAWSLPKKLWQLFKRLVLAIRLQKETGRAATWALGRQVQVGHNGICQRLTGLRAGYDALNRTSINRCPDVLSRFLLLSTRHEGSLLRKIRPYHEVCKN